MNELGIFIDISHCSPATAEDVLNISTVPVMISPNGVIAILDSQRNLRDDQIKKITANKETIGNSFFDMADGEPTLPNFIVSIRHVRDLVGIKYIALGSDYDVSVVIPFDITG